MKSISERTLADGAILRPAQPDDVPEILGLIHELAVYEREPDAVETTPEMLHAALFTEDGPAFCHVVVREDQVRGIAVFFRTFSTWVGRPGIWLEDLVVSESERGSGYGLALLSSLAELCRLNDYGRLEWTVLDWNAPAIGFYRSIGALPQDDWTTQRLDEAGITALLNRA